MKIERIETFPLLHKISKPYGDANGYKKYRSCYLIRIITNSGIDGWGECVDWLPAIHTGFTERIIPYLIGKKASDRLVLVDTVKKWHQRTAAAVSMALTEIAAKSANLSICELWGGTFRKSIPVYASFQSYSESEGWISESLLMAERAILKGYDKIKVKAGGKTFAEDLTHIKSIQKLDEGGLHFILDANQSYDMATARLWDRHFSNWPNLLWFEEPIPADDPAAYQILRSSLSVPLAGGENIKSAKKFLPLLRKNGLDIIQPDIMHAGGIDHFRETLQLARTFGVRVSPHSYDGALSRLYTLFCQASLPPWSKMAGEDIEPVEWDMMENPFSGLIPVKPSSGKVSIPDGAGIGTEIDMDLIKFHLWDGSNYQS